MTCPSSRRVSTLLLQSCGQACSELQHISVKTEDYTPVNRLQKKSPAFVTMEMPCSSWSTLLLAGLRSSCSQDPHFPVHTDSPVQSRYKYMAKTAPSTRGISELLFSGFIASNILLVSPVNRPQSLLRSTIRIILKADDREKHSCFQDPKPPIHIARASCFQAHNTAHTRVSF